MCVQPSWQTISSRCQWVLYRTRAFVHSGGEGRRAQRGTSTTEALNWPIKKELTSITERAIWKSLKVFVFVCLFGLYPVVNCVHHLWEFLRFVDLYISTSLGWWGAGSSGCYGAGCRAEGSQLKTHCRQNMAVRVGARTPWARYSTHNHSYQAP